MRRIAEVIATGLGTGYAPLAPATAGSAAALVLYWALPFEGRGDSPWFFGLVAATLAAGTWASNVISQPRASLRPATAAPGSITSSSKGDGPNSIPPSTEGESQGEEDSDPKRCVIDEFGGMWATCLFLPATWGWLLAAFVTFRALDILKPFGIRRLERLPGGIGIMADDLAAGLFGALALNLVRLVFFN